MTVSPSEPHASLDDCKGSQLEDTLGLEPFLTAVVAPLLHRIGEAWARGEIGIADEHLASQMIASRVRALRKPPIGVRLIPELADVRVALGLLRASL